MIIKCKMCGGDIEFTPGATYGTCEYCGCTSTIPKSDDENKLNLYNRANHFRRQSEFDKAVAAYERLLEQDDTDAEAHWGAVLSRYGIEYVDDPVTKRRIPTCHRVQLTSILADEDYKAAIEYAPDTESRRLYEEQAAEIAEIQKGILAVSANEKPYDVFICYKESDENGQRTRDSQWAQDIYYGLVEQGYKVFFSRITLEDKLGQEYEPYIFAALNSAKVMLVVGSKPEYFSAVWVKNEWSRYLALMSKDRKRLLIPCYRDMDPYDLPDELSSLQSQDMSKIGFMQDLLRGVKKVLDAEKTAGQPKTDAQKPADAVDAVAPGVSSLMKRAYLFMEDGDFKSASDYIDRVLDIDPEYAPAYAAKVCINFGINKEEGLSDADFVYEDNPDWQKALRFANAQQRAVYERYIIATKEHVDELIKKRTYAGALELAVDSNASYQSITDVLEEYKERHLQSAGNEREDIENLSNRDKLRRQIREKHEHEWLENIQKNEELFRRAVETNEPGDVPEENLKAAAELLDSVGSEDATACAGQCRVLAEQAGQKKIYDQAAEILSKMMFSYNAVKLDKAARLFLEIPEYKDAKEKGQECADKAESIRTRKYDDVKKLMNSAASKADWDSVIIKLDDTELDGYRDVETLRMTANKQKEERAAAEWEAKKQAEEKARKDAAAAYRKEVRTIVFVLLAVAIAIAGYILATKVIIPGSSYRKAVELRDAGEYEEAVDTFTSLGTFRDAEEQIKVTYYTEGSTSLASEDWERAIESFIKADDYNDASEQVKAAYYS